MDAATTKLCIHGLSDKSNCKWCSPHLQCEHNKLRRRCVVCTGGCEHGKKKNQCMHCNPNLMCMHGLWKYSCRQCNPPKLKNTADFIKPPRVPEPEIMRAKDSLKVNEHFMKAVRYCIAPDGENTGAPEDEQACTFLSYDQQCELVKALWTYVE